MHGSSSGGDGKKARIEIIPLIDIIFFLLATFIMVSLAMTQNQGVQVALPAAGGAKAGPDQPEPEKPLSLCVTGKGEVLYNKEKITLAQLPLRLQVFKANSKDAKVVVSSEGEADFRYVVAVMDEARKAGIAKVGINTEKR